MKAVFFALPFPNLALLKREYFAVVKKKKYGVNQDLYQEKGNAKILPSRGARNGRFEDFSRFWGLHPQGGF